MYYYCVDILFREDYNFYVKFVCKLYFKIIWIWVFVYGFVLNLDLYLFLFWILDEYFKKKYYVLIMKNEYLICVLLGKIWILYIMCF